MTTDAQTTSLAADPAPGIMRRMWGLAATILSVLYTVILAPFAALTAPFFHGHAVTHIGRLWARLIMRTCGVRLEIEGLENLAGLGPCVMVSNHQSAFDIFAILAYLPGENRFVAKRELVKIPLVGYAIAHSGHIVVDRRRGGQAIRQALEVVRHGYSICVFAEGTRFSDNRVHEFNDGAAWIGLATHLPCVPMAISGSHAIFPRGARIVVPGRRMRIGLGRPIPTEGMRSADRIELTRRLEEAVRANFVAEL